jgi:hypothetical protein
MSEQVMMVLRIAIEALEQRIFLWATLVGTFVLFLIAINSPNVSSISCAVLFAVLVFLPVLKTTVGQAGNG